MKHASHGGSALIQTRLYSIPKDWEAATVYPHNRLHHSRASVQAIKKQCAYERAHNRLSTGSAEVLLRAGINLRLLSNMKASVKKTMRGANETKAY